MDRKPLVLFLCSHNSARSQMAEGLLRAMAGERFDVHSAGTEPGVVNPFAARAMAEIGIDLAGHRAKAADEYLGREIDHLIIVCSQAAEACPATWPGARDRELWPFPDPSAATGTDDEKLAVFREVRDAIRDRLAVWIGRIAS